jgi:hypothetical protein
MEIRDEQVRAMCSCAETNTGNGKQRQTRLWPTRQDDSRAAPRQASLRARSSEEIWVEKSLPVLSCRGAAATERKQHRSVRRDPRW